jgi:hypothetical protein
VRNYLPLITVGSVHVVTRTPQDTYTYNIRVHNLVPNHRGCVVENELNSGMVRLLFVADTAVCLVILMLVVVVVVAESWVVGMGVAVVVVG